MTPQVIQAWVPSSRGWLSTALLRAKPPSDRIALFLHGWGSTKVEWDYAHATMARQLVATGTDTVLFDYVGHGESTGSLSEASFQSMVEDGHAIVEWLHNFHYTRYYVVARGLSAAVALYLAPHAEWDGTCLLSPALAIPSCLEEYPQAYLTPEVMDQGEIADALRHLGALPLHLRGESVTTEWFSRGPTPPPHIPGRCLILGDPADAFWTPARWGHHPDLDIQALPGGGPMFRRPDLISQVADTMIAWMRSVERSDRS